MIHSQLHAVLESAGLQPKIDWSILSLLAKDKRAGLKAPPGIYTLAPSAVGHSPFRSAYETTLWSYAERGMGAEIGTMLNSLSARLDAAGLPDCDLVAGWALLSDERARGKLGMRCEAIVTSAHRPTSSLEFGNMMTRLWWGFWCIKDERYRTAARALCVFAAEQQNIGSQHPAKVFMPIDGVESLVGVAVAIYGLTVGARSEGGFTEWGAKFKQRCGYLCDMVKQNGLITDQGIPSTYDQFGAVSNDATWTPDENGPGLLGAAIAGAEPTTRCYDVAKTINIWQRKVADAQGVLLLSEASPMAWGSHYESVQVFGAAT